MLLPLPSSSLSAPSTSLAPVSKVDSQLPKRAFEWCAGSLPLSPSHPKLTQPLQIDGIFGSNETSRALSSIITLVRTEFSHATDSSDSPAHPLATAGRIASLTALTKALTAFACLQTATHKRSASEMRMKVVFDCTVQMGESREKRDMWGMGRTKEEEDRRRSLAGGLNEDDQELEELIEV